MKMDEIKVDYESVKDELVVVGEHAKMQIILKLSFKKPFTLDELQAKNEMERAEFKKIVNMLVKENILCHVGYSYRLHSTSVKSYLNEIL